MKKVIRLTESDLNKIVKRVIEEQTAVGAVANAAEIVSTVLPLIIKVLPQAAIGSILWAALSGNAKGVGDAINQYRNQLGKDYQMVYNALTKGDLSKIANGLLGLAKSKVSYLKNTAQQGLGNKTY